LTGTLVLSVDAAVVVNAVTLSDSVTVEFGILAAVVELAAKVYSYFILLQFL
jgi:hypothetical protein